MKGKLLNMLAELKAKSQVTIPKKIVDNLKLSQGDKFEIREENGAIVLTPVVIYPQKVIDELKENVEDMKKQLSKGEVPVFDNIDDLIADLDK